MRDGEKEIDESIGPARRAGIQSCIPIPQSPTRGEAMLRRTGEGRKSW